jgi:L-rhamnose mutarotase
MRIATKMKLLKGFEAEYKERHDEIWPELSALLKQTGISNYYIYLDKETNSLFAVLDVKDKEALDNLPFNPVMKKWWTYMKDIMETNPDDSPLSLPLEEVFFLP